MLRHFELIFRRRMNQSLMTYDSLSHPPNDKNLSKKYIHKGCNIKDYLRIGLAIFFTLQKDKGGIVVKGVIKNNLTFLPQPLNVDN